MISLIIILIAILSDSHDSEEFMTSKKAYLAESAWVEGEIRKLNCDVVFSHGDIWWGNIVYNEQDGETRNKYFSLNLNWYPV